MSPAFSSPKRLALGCMNMAGPGRPDDLTPARIKKAIEAFEAALISGITLFDHADIYGGGACEAVFKYCLEALPESRALIQIWTKCGITNSNGIGHYNLSPEYIETCIDHSLARLGIEHIDLFQLHRPDPLSHPARTAEALTRALDSGKIGAVGVSNYFPEQTRALQKYLDAPILSNQFEINALRLSPFYEGWDVPHFGGYSNGTVSFGDGTLDFCMAHEITPLAYSPLARATLTKAQSDDGREQDVQDVLGTLAQNHNATRTQVALAWLLTHPAGIIPIFGSNNPTHIFEAAQRNDLRLSHEEWYRVWVASWDRNVP